MSGVQVAQLRSMLAQHQGVRPARAWCWQLVSPAGLMMTDDDIPQFTPSIAKLLRNSSTLLATSHSGTAGLRDLMLLAGPPKIVDVAINAFYRWVQLEHMGVEPAEVKTGLRAATDINKEPPLLIAGLLTEYANYIDQLLDVANNLTDVEFLLVQRGWHQGGEVDLATGRVCLLGAIDCVLYHNSSKQPAATAQLFTTFNRIIGIMRMHLNTASLADWNDSPERTFNDVLTLIREVKEHVLRVER